MATLTKKDSISEWSGYKIGDKVELAFPGYWLQDSTRFPNPNECYWVKGEVTETHEKACVVTCPSIHLDRVMVLDKEGIRHYDKERLDTSNYRGEKM